MKSSLSLPLRQFRPSAINIQPARRIDVRENVSTPAPRALSKVSTGYRHRKADANKYQVPAADLPECLASVPMASLHSLHLGGKLMGGGVFGRSAIRKSTASSHFIAPAD